MPSFELLQNGARVFVVTSCGSSARPEELVSDLGQRTNNHDWVISQASIHDLAEAANRRRILNRSAAKLHDHASRSFVEDAAAIRPSPPDRRDCPSGRWPGWICRTRSGPSTRALPPC